MTARPDADRVVLSWMDLVPDEAPDRVIAAVLDAVERTPQARRPLPRIPWRTSPMLRLALLAGATILLGAAILGGALLGGGGPAPSPAAGPATPAAVVPAPSPVAPVATPRASAPAKPVPAPEDIRGGWLAADPGDTPFGPLDGHLKLIVNLAGTFAWLQAPPGNEAVRSVPDGSVPGELALTLSRSGWGCDEGATGRYRWATSPDRLTLTLEPIEDPCAARTKALARTWTRTHDGVSGGGTAVVPDVGPLVQVTLPEGSYTTRPLDGAQEIYDQARDYLLYVFLNPQAFADPCDTDQKVPWKPGAQAFVDALKQNPGFTDFKTEPLEVGGYPALRVTLRANPDHPRCEGDHAFYEWTPEGTSGYWWLSAGDPDEFYLVDHPDATLMFQVLPVADPTTAEVIGSVKFLDALPTAAP